MSNATFPSVRRRRSPKEIARVLRDYRSSGLSQSAFARARDLSQASLSRWVRRSTTDPCHDEPHHLVPVTITEAIPFLPGPTGTSFELSVGMFRLTIPPDFDPDCLRRLLPLLAERC